MTRVCVVVGLLLVLCAAGCRQADSERRYELLPSERGVFRFDHETGDVATMLGSSFSLQTLELLPARGSVAGTRDDEAELGAIRSFPPIVLEDLGGVTASLTTRWWNERVYLRLTLEPPEPELLELYAERPSLKMMVHLKSAGGFNMGWFDFRVSALERIRGEAGRTTALEYGIWEVMSSDEYRQAVEWNLKYRLES